MKAVIRTQYGTPSVAQFAEVATPTPADNEVMIKLRAASVNPLDLFLMKGMPWNRAPGLRKPKHEVLGCDIAGQVEAGWKEREAVSGRRPDSIGIEALRQRLQMDHSTDRKSGSGQPHHRESDFADDQRLARLAITFANT